MFSDMIFLLCILSLTSFLFGYVLDKKIKMPWMFSVLLLGIFIAPFSLFSETVNSKEFEFLSQLGMMGFLFLIGLNLNLSKIKELGGYIILASLTLNLIEGLTIASILYYFFPSDVSNSFTIAIIVGLGFGTIGEVVLLAILMEFHIEDTDFGQITLGMGVFDDIIEITLIALVAFLPELQSSGKSENLVNPVFLILNLVGLIIVLFINVKLGKKIKTFIVNKKKLPPFVIPFIILTILYLYITFASLASEVMNLVGAIFAGVAVKAILPEKIMEKQGDALKYAISFVISPIFFFSMGYKISLFAILIAPVLVLMIISITLSTRILGSIVIFRKKLGSSKNSALLGLGICTKFSTSIIILTILFTSGLLSQFMFSVLMAAFIIMKPIIIIGYSRGVSSIASTIKVKEKNGYESKK